METKGRRLERWKRKTVEGKMKEKINKLEG